MRKFIASFCIAAALTAPASLKAETPASSAYNAELAEELGADEYGMRAYVFVMLRTGPADSEINDEEQRSEMFQGHFSNMVNLAKQGKLVLAGPLSNGTNERGLFVLNVSSVEEAQSLMEGDPTINAGIFTAEYLNYYGSAALLKLNDIHATIQKTSIE